MLKIKKKDEVVVVAGRDKGRRGEVLRVMKDGRMMVAGINMVKKHKRPNPNTGDQGGIVPQEAPIQSSNIAIWRIWPLVILWKCQGLLKSPLIWV